MHTGTAKGPLLITERLIIRLPIPRDAARMVAYQQANRAHFAPWSPKTPEGYYTEEYWGDRLSSYLPEFEAGRSVRLIFVRRADPEGPIIGECNFTEVVRGPFQACFLGCNLDIDHVGHGYMKEALGAALRFAFDELRLHRVMANYMPANIRSARLLKGLGFVVEGYARDYLFLADAWQDHVLTALINPRPVEPV